MGMLRSLGGLSFVLGVAILALDAARSMNLGYFDTTSVESFWSHLGGDDIFRLRYTFSDWFGPMADHFLELPAAFFAFGLGVACLLVTIHSHREGSQKPLLF